ncbi:MAG: tetratricopeptide repeat protein [Marinibacterium sp.]
MLRSTALVICLSLAAAGAGADCPAPPDHSDALTALFARVQAATDQDAAREITNAMWELWAEAPDEPAQALLDSGMERRAAYDFLGAIDAFNRLTAYCPDYAEGYNQRAFVHFLRQDFAAALPDLDRALDLSPRHLGALSGKALTLMGLDRFDEARLVIAQALALNPWLPERGLAARGGPLAPVGDDI